MIHHDKINRSNCSLKFIFETDHWDVLTTLLDRGTSFHIFVPPSARWTHMRGDPTIAVASEVLALVLGIANRAGRARAGLHSFVAQASLEGHEVKVEHFGIHLHAALARADGDGCLHGGTGATTLAGRSGGCRNSAARTGRLDSGRVAGRAGVGLVAVGRNADGSLGEHLLDLVAREANLLATGHLEALGDGVGGVLGVNVR